MTSGIRSEAMDGDMLRLALQVSQTSRDPSTQVGGVLVLVDGTVVARCNTFLSMTDEELQEASREQRLADVLHAEEVLLMEAAARGAWYYGTHEPCGRCWKLLERAGVTRVVYVATDADRRQRWSCDDPGAQRARARLHTTRVSHQP